MSMAERITAALEAQLQPQHIELVNESHMHSGPGSETHWNLIIVSPSFDGERLVRRQRAVYKALNAEMQDGIHALTMKTLTPAEWQARGGQVENVSPSCRGGSKHEPR